MKKIEDIAKAHGGFVTSRQVTAAGIPRARLADMVQLEKLIRVHRGVYCLADVWEDEFLALQLRFPKGTFSDGTALYLHELTDRTPFVLTMTFPRSYRATKAREEGVEVRTCSDDVIALGAITLNTPYGNEVHVYDIERTLCDLVRGRAVPDVQIVNPAMKAYVGSKRRDIQKLLVYARKLGVERKIRNYLEVLL